MDKKRMPDTGYDQDRQSSQSIEHRLREFLRRNGWWLILTSFMASMGLGFFGFKLYAQQNGTGWTNLDCIYGAIQLIIMESGGFSANLDKPKNLMLEWARFLVPLFGIVALLETLAKIAREKTDQLIIRLFFRKHIIICGLGEKGKRLAKSHYDNNERVVVIEQNEQNENISSIKVYNSLLFRWSIKVFVGNAADKILLHSLNVHKAKRLYAITSSDDVNIRIARRVRRILGEDPGCLYPKLECYIHIMDENLFDFLNDNDPFIDTNEFNAKIFNVYEQDARFMFQKYNPDMPFLHGNIQRGRPLKILIAGVGWLGKELLLKFIRTGHFANLSASQITVIDQDEAKIAALKETHQVFTDYSNMFVKLCFETHDIRKIDKKFFDNHIFDIAYLCLGNENLGLACAAKLRKDGLIAAGTPIIIGIPQASGISEVLEESMKDKNIYLFNLLDEMESLSKKDPDEFAKFIHESWRKIAKKPHNDDVDWKVLPKDAKDSNRSNADHLDIRLRAIGCKIEKKKPGLLNRLLKEIIDELNNLPRVKELLTKVRDKMNEKDQGYTLTLAEKNLIVEMEHQRYCAEKLLQGWSYGLERSNERKKNPLIVPFTELSPDDKQYNLQQLDEFLESLSIVEMKIVKDASRNTDTLS